MNRREFIRDSTTSLPIFFFSESNESKKIEFPENKICFLSAETWEGAFSKSYSSNQLGSTYSELNIQNGKIEQTILPMENGHFILSISETNNLVLMCPYLGSQALVYDRKQKKILKYLEAPKNFLFSGHACANDNYVFLPLKHFLFEHDNKSEGKILIYDKKDIHKIDEINSHGVWPHDISYFQDQIAVAHTGTNGPLINPKKFQYDNSASNIVTLKNNVLHKKYPTNGFSPSHLSFLANKIFFNSVQWMSPRSENVELFENVEGFQFAFSERIHNRISSPEPFFIIDLDKKKLTQISLPANLGRRAVEVLADEDEKCCYATFSHSDTLIKMNWDGSILKSKKAFDFGLTEIRGLDFLGKNYLVISGKHRGIAIIDRISLEPIVRYDVSTYSNTHLSVL